MRKRKIYYIGAVVIAVIVGDFFWAGMRLRSEDAHFREFVRTSSKSLIPRIYIELDRLEYSAVIECFQFFLNPMRQDVRIEYARAGAYSGGYRAEKQIDGSWTVIPLRGAGPS